MRAWIRSVLRRGELSDTDERQRVRERAREQLEQALWLEHEVAVFAPPPPPPRQ